MTSPENSADISSVEQQRREQLAKEKPRAYEKVMQFAEKIKRGESIAFVALQYNYRCNFRCVHCSIKRFQDGRKTRSLTPDDVREFARQADELGLVNICITGGEPLIFPDLDQIFEALDPKKFHITMDTNGWFLDDAMAQRLKNLGLDKTQISLDSLDAETHDAFRRHPGAHARVIQAIDSCLKFGIRPVLATVVTKQRVRSDEFIEYLEFAKSKGIATYVTYAKPIGSWQGNFDVLVDRADMDYMRELEKHYDVFTHLTPSYGMDLGCIAVKRMICVTQFGDILPCAYIQTSLGNIFEEPLKDIIERGMKIKCFREHTDTCLIAEDREFINKYAVKMYDKPLPVPYTEIFDEEDYR